MIPYIMTASSRSFTALLLPFFVGCADVDLDITLGASQVEVDTRCETECGGSDQLQVDVGISNEGRRDSAVEIRQYRVDYELLDVQGQVPFYADEMLQEVTVESPATFSVRAAGSIQREWIVKQFGYDRIDGTATLTLAGHDEDDQLVLAEASFAIAFGDFAVAGDGKDGGTP
jgi:hypothetical protein